MPQSLLALTPSSGSPATIYVNTPSITKVVDYVSADLPTAHSDVVFSAPSAFLGDQQSVIVDELNANILAASASPTTTLISLTVGGVATTLNAYNIITVVETYDSLGNPTGSKIQYKEFGNVTYIFCSELPSGPGGIDTMF